MLGAAAAAARRAYRNGLADQNKVPNNLFEG
jgi:hypothetical protein